jgi:Domain of unknown function (DUF4440)
MKLSHCAAVLMVSAFTAAPLAAFAQTARAPRIAAETPLAKEALAFRDKIRAAIAAKDRKALEAAYADNFGHLRDSGRIDYKSDRIALVLSGEPTIESAPEENMVVQVFEPATVAVIAVSPVKDRQTGLSPRFRWLSVYVKQADGWKVAVSQASRVQPSRR